MIILILSGNPVSLRGQLVRTCEEVTDARANAEHPAVEAETGLLGHLRLTEQYLIWITLSWHSSHLACHHVAHQSLAGVNRSLAGVVEQHHTHR